MRGFGGGGERRGKEMKGKKKNLNPEMLPPIPARSFLVEEVKCVIVTQVVCVSFQSTGLSLVFKRWKQNC